MQNLSDVSEFKRIQKKLKQIYKKSLKTNAFKMISAKIFF